MLILIYCFLLSRFIIFFFLKVYWLIFGWARSSSLCLGFLWLWPARATFRFHVWASHCSAFSFYGALTPGPVGSAVVAHWLSCPVACEIFPDEGPNLCPLRWQVSSLPLDTRGLQVWQFLFYRKGNRNSQKLSNFSKVTQPIKLTFWFILKDVSRISEV